MKLMTRSKAEAKRRKAVEFLHRIGNDGLAEEFEDMTAEEYAEHKGAELIHNPQQGGSSMAQATKAELHEAMDEALEILNEAYTPESSREELAQAVGRALNALEVDDDDSDDVEGEDSDDAEDDDSNEIEED